MNAPHEFHGTSGDVTVALSAAKAATGSAEPKPRAANSARNIRLGSTSAMYWSPATTLSPKPNRTPSDRAGPRPGPFDHRRDQPVDETLLEQRPEGDGGDDQPDGEQHVSIPPRDSSRSMSAMPEFIWNPLAIVFQTAWMEPTIGLAWPPISWMNPLTTSRCRIVAWIPAKMAEPSSASDAGAFADRQERQQHQRQQVQRRDPEDGVELGQLDVLIGRVIGGRGPDKTGDGEPDGGQQKAGTLVQICERICVYRSTPTICEVRMVVSDSGEVLSPR